jgi:3-hydroxyisobutyrate dehydrogenase-like beta-hydroxyacid dehydrogenase
MFALRDLLKDLNLALELVDEVGGEAPMTAMSRALVADAAWESPDLDVTAVIRPYRAAASSDWTASQRRASV